MKIKLLLGLSLICNFAFSQNIFRDNFSTYTVGQQLSGQGTWTNNSSLAGGLGTCAGVGCLNAKVLNTSINYGSYGTATQSVELKPDTDGCGTAFPAITGNEMYFGMVINLSATSVPATEFFRVSAGSNTNIPFRITARLLQPGFYNIGVSKGNGAVFYFSGAMATNTNHLLIVRYTRNSGTADDILRLYVNPSVQLGEPATADSGTATGTDIIGNIDRMTFRQNASTGLPTGRAGLVSVSGNWNGLRFSTLNNSDFANKKVEIGTSQIKNGLLSILSNQSNPNVLLQIFNIQGKLLENKTVSLNEGENSINIKPIAGSGIYIVKMNNNIELNLVKKIIVN